MPGVCEKAAARAGGKGAAMKTRTVTLVNKTYYLSAEELIEILKKHFDAPFDSHSVCEFEIDGGMENIVDWFKNEDDIVFTVGTSETEAD